MGGASSGGHTAAMAALGDEEPGLGLAGCLVGVFRVLELPPLSLGTKASGGSQPSNLVVPSR